MIFLIDILVAFLILSETFFLGILKIPNAIYNVLGYKTKIFLSVICIFLLLIYLLYWQNKKGKPKQNFSFFVILFEIFVIVIALFSSGIYHQSFGESFRMSYFYVILLSYFFFNIYFIKFHKFEFFSNFFILMGFFYSTALILQVLVLKFVHFIFLNFSEKTIGLLEYRDYGIRISKPTDFIVFALLLVLVKIILDKGNNLINYLCISVFYCYIIFISMTRISILMSTSMIIFVILLKIGRKHRWFSFLLINAFTISALLSSETIYNLLFQNSARQNSLTIRTNALTFFSDQIFDNIVFGRGFPSDNLYYYLNHGVEGRFFVTDMGILGFFSIFGALGIISITILFLKIFSIIKKGDKKFRGVTILLAGYLILSLPTMFLFDPQRILFLVLLLSLFDYFSSNPKDEKISYS